MRHIFKLAVVMAWPALAAAQSITFEAPGADDDLQALLRDASLLVGFENAEGTPDAQDIVAAARADYRRLLTALYADGYYGGSISITLNGREAAGIAPLDAPDRITTATVTVDPGPRFTFARTEVAPVPPGTQLPEGFQPGEAAQSDVIRQGVNAGVSAWRDAGHARAAPAGQQISADHRNRTLDAAVRIAPGPRLTFGPLSVSGNVAVRTDRILRIAGLPTGEVYSPAEIARAERRLRRTGAFDSVALVEAEENGPGDTLPVTAQLVESKPRRIGFGIELSSIEGLKVSSYWMHRNIAGGAERFRVEGEVAGIGGGTGGTDYRLGASLSRPAVLGPDTHGLAQINISREDEPDYLLDQASANSSLTRIIGEDLELEGGIGVLTAREETPRQTREYTYLTLPLSATLDRRDNDTDARNGYFIDISATPFIGLHNMPNGARLFGDARAYRSFGADDRFTLAARAQVGSLVGATLDEAPADYLFYSGGGGTVRGQQYKSLGVDRTFGGKTVRTGGLSFAGAQIEARVLASDNIGIVGFYDFGYVGSDEIPGQNGDWHSGAGIGVRYNTGIGPIRLDVATPANGPRAGQRVEVYIGIGQSF